MAALLGLGFYFPTSAAENISVNLYLAGGASLLGLLILLLMRRRGLVSVGAVVNATAINVILLVATLFSPLKEFAYGGFIPIFLLSLLICVSVRDLNLTTAVRRLFDAANALNITLAALLLLDVTAVRQFFLTHYAFGYDDLLPYMFDERKPVIMFGSHSVAGFFFYLLFYMTFQTFVMTRSKLNLVYALCYLALLASLASFTSAVFA